MSKRLVGKIRYTVDSGRPYIISKEALFRVGPKETLPRTRRNSNPEDGSEVSFEEVEKRGRWGRYRWATNIRWP